MTRNNVVRMATLQSIPLSHLRSDCAELAVFRPGGHAVNEMGHVLPGLLAKCAFTVLYAEVIRRWKVRNWVNTYALLEPIGLHIRRQTSPLWGPPLAFVFLTIMPTHGGGVILRVLLNNSASPGVGGGVGF